MVVAQVVFWGCVAALVYTYFGYPLLLRLIQPRPAGRPAADVELPSVTVLIAGYNEADVIGETIRNKLSQDYPEHLLDVLFISDGSTDGTEDIVEALVAESAGRVRLLRQAERQGKTAALNVAVKEITSDIIVFSDANSMYAQDAVRRLAGRFSDPTVGYVTGKMVYVSDVRAATGDGCSAYMRYENGLRQLESEISSIVGVDGGIDAMRRELYTEMRPDQLPDFVLSLHTVRAGYRAVYEPTAVLHEALVSNARDEYRMRVRVSLRALWALFDMRELMNPFRYGVFALQFFSHKVLRYLAFWLLAGALVSSAVLFNQHWIYRAALAVQLAFYILAGWGYLTSRRGPVPAIGYIPYYFLLVNVAAGQAFLKFLLRIKQSTWQPRGG